MERWLEWNPVGLWTRPNSEESWMRFVVRSEPALRPTVVGNTLIAVGNMLIVVGNTLIDSGNTLIAPQGSLANSDYFGRGRR